MKPASVERTNVDASDAAIARVLQAEREARETIARTRREAADRVELARHQAAALSERTERRLRAVVAAFEADTQRQLAQLDAETAGWSQAQAPTPQDLAQLAQAVRTLARELVQGPP